MATAKKTLSPQEKIVAQSKRNEAKAAKFKELAGKRVSKLLAQIENVSRLSNRNSYTYNAEQVTKILNACSESFKAMEASFKSPTSAAKGSFSL
jgi:hypothetical protein